MIPLSLWKRIHALMPIVCVDVAVLHVGEVLLLWRTKAPLRGERFLPGGRILKGESYREAAQRIVLAETGLRITEPILCGVRETVFEDDPFGHGKGTHTVNLVCRAGLSRASQRNGPLRLDDQHSAYEWTETLNVLHEEGFHRYLRREVECAMREAVEV